MIKLYQTRHKWMTAGETKDCFMFLIHKDYSINKYIKNVWWRNGIGWSINNYQDTFIGELKCEQ